MADSGRLCVNTYQPDELNQQWQFNKSRKVIEKRFDLNTVLDVVGECKDNGAEICAWDYHGRDNQLWTLNYL